MRCHVTRLFSMRMRAGPGQKRHPAQQDETVHFLNICSCQRPDTAITIKPGRAQGRHLRMILHKADAGGKIIHEPASPAVIEINQPGDAVCDQQIGKPHVGMDQPKALRPPAIGRQPLAYPHLGTVQNIAFGSTNPGPVAPVTPDRCLSEHRVIVPDKTFKGLWAWPADCMKMGPRCQLPQRMKGQHQIVIRVRFHPGKPFKHDELARGDVSGAKFLHHRTIAPGNRDRGINPGIRLQRRHPGQFALNGQRAVITRAMHPQNAAIAATSLNQKSGIFRKIDQPRGGIRGCVPQAKRCRCETGQIIGMGFLQECGCHVSSLPDMQRESMRCSMPAGWRLANRESIILGNRPSSFGQAVPSL